MSADTVVYRNCVILIGGASLAGQFNELTLNYKSEMLDRTTFGDTTRNRRGGLFSADVAGKGLSVQGTNLVEDVLFAGVGTSDIAVPLVVWPDGVTEGSQTGRGYAMLGAFEHLNVGGAVGTLLPFDFAAQSAGLGY